MAKTCFCCDGLNRFKRRVSETCQPSRWTWLSWCQNVSILDFIGVEADGGGEW